MSKKDKSYYGEEPWGQLPKNYGERCTENKLRERIDELEAQLKEAQDCLLLIRGRARGARYTDNPGLLLFRIVEDVTSYVTSYMDSKKRKEAKP